MPFNNYPYTNLNDINLDFLLKNAAGAIEATEQAKQSAEEAKQYAEQAETAAASTDFPYFKDRNYLSVRNSPGAVNRILTAAATYLRNPIFQYGNWHGAFNTTCIVDPDTGLYDIDCVTLTELILRGVDFNRSRYAGNNDNYGLGGCNYPIEAEYTTVARPYGMLSGQLARYAYMHGWYWKPTSADELLPGDVVFCHTGNTPSSWPGSGITHCATVVCVYQNTVVVIEVQNTNPIVRLSYRTIDDNDIISAARFPLQDFSAEPINIFENKWNNKGFVTEDKAVNIAVGARTAAIKTLYIDPADIVSDIPYTFIVDCPQNKESWEWFLEFASSQIVAAEPMRQGTKIAYRVFFKNQNATALTPQGPNANGMYYVTIILRIPASDSLNTTLNFNRVQLFKGYQNPDENNQARSESENEKNVLETYSTESDLITALNSWSDDESTSNWHMKFVRLSTAGANVAAGYYVAFEWASFESRAIRSMYLLRIGNAQLYTRYYASGTWTTFNLTSL